MSNADISGDSFTSILVLPSEIVNILSLIVISLGLQVLLFLWVKENNFQLAVVKRLYQELKS